MPRYLPGTAVGVKEERWESCGGHSGEASREVGEWGSGPHSCLPTRCPPPGSDQLHRHRRGGVQRLWPSLPSLLR